MPNTTQDACFAINAECQKCPTPTSLTGMVALVQQVITQSMAIRHATSATAVADLVASGVAVMLDNVNYPQGVTETVNIKSYAVADVNSFTPKSHYGCSYNPIKFIAQRYPIRKHTVRIDGEYKECLNSLRGKTFDGMDFRNPDDSINEAAAQAHFVSIMTEDFVDNVNGSLVFGQRNNSIISKGGAAFDGLFKKTKLAAQTTYANTLNFDLSAGTGFTYVGSTGTALFFADAFELAEYLSELASHIVTSVLAYGVIYNDTTKILTVTSRLSAVPIEGVFRLFNGDVTLTVCAQTVSIMPTVIQRAMPTMASPLVTPFGGAKPTDPMKELLDFVQACFDHSVVVGKSFGNQQKLIVLVDPQMFLGIALKEAFKACCQNNNNLTQSESANKFFDSHNISLVPFEPFTGHGLFFATTPGNIEILTAGQKDASAGAATFMFSVNDCKEHVISYAAQFGMFIKDTSLVCTNANGHSLYDRLDGTATYDKPECNIATCPEMQSNCIPTVTNNFQTVAKVETALCNGALAIKVKDITNYGTQIHNGTSFTISYHNGTSTQSETITTAAGVKDALFVIDGAFTFNGVVTIGSDVASNSYTQSTLLAPAAGDCSDLTAICVTRDPKNPDGNNPQMIETLLLDYGNYNSVTAEWVSFDIPTNTAKYTLYLFDTVIPTPVGNDIITIGACA